MPGLRTARTLAHPSASSTVSGLLTRPHGSKFHRELELAAMAGKIRKIECAGPAGFAPGNLHIPSRGHECFPGELQVERRAEIDRVAGKAIEADPVVMAQIPQLGADQQRPGPAHR